MKKLIFTLLFFLAITTGFSQSVYKWRASDYSSRLNSGQGWSLWSEWATSGVLIVAQNERVNVYSSTPQVYDMIEGVIRTYDDKSNPIYSVMCVDENGTKCKMIWYHSSSDGSFVVFQFSNLELMYKVVSLD